MHLMMIRLICSFTGDPVHIRSTLYCALVFDFAMPLTLPAYIPIQIYSFSFAYWTVNKAIILHLRLDLGSCLAIRVIQQIILVPILECFFSIGIQFAGIGRMAILSCRLHICICIWFWSLWFSMLLPTMAPIGLKPLICRSIICLTAVG